ncbi:MAG: hypothetical protein M1839_001108 [Geoglossum umbratile]|nr:MAG: hypothetical protein M1839_001108 [Geoglossum umbratile]
MSSANWRQRASPNEQNQRTATTTPSPSKNEPLAAPQSIADGRRLYVGNMPYMAKTEDIEALFARHGFKVAHIDISLDPFSGRNPSYCFVDLEAKEQADRALRELNGQDLLGRPVKIGPGIAKSSRGGSNRAPQRRDANRASATPFVFDHWYGYSDQGLRLYVGGLPSLPDQPTVNAEIRALFRDFNVNAVSKIIPPHPSKRALNGNHHYLFVDFGTAEEADAARKAVNGVSLPWGGRAVVSHARGDSKRVEERNRWGVEQGEGEVGDV